MFTRLLSVSFLCMMLLGISEQSASAGSRFFVLVADDAPSQRFIRSATKTAAEAGSLVTAERGLEAITGAYPALSPSFVKAKREAIASELKTGTRAHYATRFDQAEAHFAVAFDAVYADPTVIGADEAMLTQLADGTALRYSNTLARGGAEIVARRHLNDFLRRYPTVSPTRADHPPNVIESWDKAVASVNKRTGELMVAVVPLELERSGSCSLHLNGANAGRMPLARPIALPVGEHMMQVHCGFQQSWLQKVSVAKGVVSVKVPLRAMLATRLDVESGGLVIVRPEDSDTRLLIEAVSEASSLDGAIIVEEVIGRALVGDWTRGARGPSYTKQGTIADDEIGDVGPYAASSNASDADTDTGGRVWTWVAGGLGLALVGGGVATNLLFNSEVDDYDALRQELGPNDPEVRQRHDEVNDSALKPLTMGLMIGGGALLATSIVLFFVEGADSGSSASTNVGFSSSRPGGLSVSF